MSRSKYILFWYLKWHSKPPSNRKSRFPYFLDVISDNLNNIAFCPPRSPDGYKKYENLDFQYEGGFKCDFKYQKWIRREILGLERSWDIGRASPRIRIPGVRVSHPGQIASDLAISRSSPLDRGNFMGCFPIHPYIFLISTLEPLQITSDLMKPSKKRQN